MNKIKITNLIAREGRNIKPSKDLPNRIKSELGIQAGQKKTRSHERPGFSYVLAGGLAFGVVALIALAVVLAGVGFPGEITETYISIDINPSIELCVSSEDIVTSVRPMNEDAAVLLFGEDLEGIDIGDAIDLIIDLAIEFEYIKEEGGNALKYVVINGKPDTEFKMSEKVKNEIQNKLNQSGIACEVLAKFGNVTFAEANIQRVSIGKMELIKAVREKDKSLKVKDLKMMSVAKLNEIILLYSSEKIRLIEDDIEEDLNENRRQKREQISSLEDLQSDIDEKYNVMKTIAESNPNDSSQVKGLVQSFNEEYDDVYKFSYSGQGNARHYYNALNAHFNEVLSSVETQISTATAELLNAGKNCKKDYKKAMGSQSGHSGQGHGNGNPSG